MTATLTTAAVLILPFAATRMPQRHPDAPVIEPLTFDTMVGFVLIVLIVLGCALATGGVRFPRRFSEGHKIAGTGAELVHGRTS